MVQDVNLDIPKGYAIRVNEAVLRVTRDCMPSRKIEQALGYGGLNAACNHRGVIAVAPTGGIIRTGDEVKAFSELGHTLYGLRLVSCRLIILSILHSCKLSLSEPMNQSR